MAAEKALRISKFAKTCLQEKKVAEVVDLMDAEDTVSTEVLSQIVNAAVDKKFKKMTSKNNPSTKPKKGKGGGKDKNRTAPSKKQSEKEKSTPKKKPATPKSKQQQQQKQPKSILKNRVEFAKGTKPGSPDKWKHNGSNSRRTKRRIGNKV